MEHGTTVTLLSLLIIGWLLSGWWFFQNQFNFDTFGMPGTFIALVAWMLVPIWFYRWFRKK